MNRNKILIIGIVIILILLGVGIFFIIKSYFEPYKVVENTNSNEVYDSFINLTKEEAIDYLESHGKTNSLIPDNFVNPLVKLKDYERRLNILYSYEDFNDIKSIAKESLWGAVNGFNNASGPKYTSDKIHIKSISDAYAVIYVEENEVDCSLEKCYKGVIFNKKYLDYHEVVTVENGRTYKTDERIFKNLDSSFVKEAMAILIYSTNTSYIYDYDFKETDDSFIFNLYIIGVGYDMNQPYNSDPIKMVINLIENTAILDKNTGKISWKTGKQENRNTVLKSFSITQEEYQKIYE